MPPERPRRTIEEIIQLHAREGHKQQEVFVEGVEDKYFYEQFLRQSGLPEIAVLQIDTVEVPTQAVLDLNLSDGHKGRVVALAALLEGKVKINEVVCIADADSDHFNARAYGFTLLLLTDYTSIELYAYNEDVLGKVLRVGLGGFPKSAGQVLQELREPLELAFMVRVAAVELDLPNDAFPLHSSYCSFNRQRTVLSFRLRDYANISFQRQNDKSWRAKLEGALPGLRERLQPDPRLQIHGHDFRNTLFWYVRQHTGYGVLNADTMNRLLLAFIDKDNLRHEDLFTELIRRLTLP